MTVLLDTHLVLWLAEGSPRLPRGVEATIFDLGTPTFSIVSLWEVAIKTRLGRADLNIDARVLRHALLANGYAELPVSGDQAAAVADPPTIHGDPFDRLLVAPARMAGLILLIADRKMADCGSPVRLV